MGRLPSLKRIQSDDPVLNRLQDALREALQPLLSNPLNAAADFRLTEIAATSSGGTPTFVLQYRSPGLQTWTSVCAFASNGDLSTAISLDVLQAAGDLLYGSAKGAVTRLANGVTGQLLQAGASAPVWAGDTVWTAPTLLNSWVNFGSGNQVAGFFRDANGFVHLRGMVKSGTLTLAAFTLPAGYRPSANVNFACVSNGAFGQCFVDSSGNVMPQTGSNIYFDFGGITFDTRA